MMDSYTKCRACAHWRNDLENAWCAAPAILKEYPYGLNLDGPTVSEFCPSPSLPLYEPKHKTADPIKITDSPACVEIAFCDDQLIALDLVAHLHRQKAFSEKTFGPGARTQGVLDHIRKELIEVEAAPDDVTEWIDLVLLALDGAWRAGHSPEAIATALYEKQRKNEARDWPDWRTADPDKAIEHDRGDAHV